MIFNSPWPLNAPKLVIYEPHILAMAVRYVAIYKISNVIGEGREWAILHIIKYLKLPTSYHPNFITSV